MAGYLLLIRKIRLPLLIFTVVILIGLTISWSVHRLNEERIRIATQITAEQVVLRIESWIDSRVHSLRRLQREAPGIGGNSIEDFRNAAQLLYQTYSGFQAINWIDSTGVIRMIYPVEGNEPALGRNLYEHAEPSVPDALSKAIASGELRRTGSVQLLQGGNGFATYLPVHDPEGRLVGLINGVFRVDDLIHTCLAESSLRERYRFACVDSLGRVVSHHNKPEVDLSRPDQTVISVNIVDVPWRFVMAPSQAFRNRFQTWTVLYLHLATSIVALVAALLTLMIQNRQRSLHAREREYRELFEGSHDPVYMSSLEGTILAANGAMIELFGYSADELTRLNAVDLYANPKDRGKLHEDISGKGFVRGYPVTLRSRDGRLLDCLLTTNLRHDDHGRPSGYQGIIRDVTEQNRAHSALQASEENLATLLDSIGDAVIATDTQGLILRMNPVACRITGWSFEEAAGRPLPEVLKVYESGALDKVINPVERVMRDGNILHLTTGTMLVDRDGKRYHIADSGAPIRGRDGSISGVVLVFRDITVEHHLQEQLRQAQKMEAIGRLAGGVAHDFNNLLTAITGNTDLALLRLEPGDPIHHELEQVQKTAERAANLTRQLLAFSRRQIISSRPVDLNRILGEMGTMLGRLIGEHIELKLQLAADLPRVLSDPAQIEQVIMNLVVNAADAMPEGGVLTIESERATLNAASAEKVTGLAAGEYALLHVSDTGTGIPQEVQNRIFEPFFTTKQGGKGTGLGLATVYGIVKQAGGDVQLRTRIGEGSRFTVYLPGVRIQGQAEPDQTLETPRLNGKESILVVEDETAVADLTTRALIQYGYEAVSAGNGEEALEICNNRSEPFDLVVTDVVMPKMGGVEFVRVLETLWPEIRVLFISGYHEELNIERVKLSRHQYLQKPFRPVELLQRIRALLDAEL